MEQIHNDTSVQSLLHNHLSMQDTKHSSLAGSVSADDHTGEMRKYISIKIQTDLKRVVLIVLPHFTAGISDKQSKEFHKQQVRAKRETQLISARQNPHASNVQAT